MDIYKVYAETNIGKIRENNEDNFYCDGIYKEDITLKNFQYEREGYLESPLVIGVFDGMGGTQAGEQASYIAVKCLKAYVSWLNEKKQSFDGKYMLQRTNHYMCRVMKKISKGMGSTAVLLNYESGRVRITNLGDSRAYLFREKKLHQLSVDHTTESHMREIQKSMGISKSIEESGMQHALTQHLGIPEEEFLLEPAESEWISVQRGDIFLLCSDGLTNMVKNDRIADILGANTNLQAKKRCLIQEALDHGGKDNITVILLEV